MNTINFEDLNNEYILIDIRDKSSYDKFHLEGAINIDFNKLLINPSSYLNHDNKYCFYCDKGLSSLSLSNILNKLGYNTFSLKDGLNSKKNTFI